MDPPSSNSSKLPLRGSPRGDKGEASPHEGEMAMHVEIKLEGGAVQPAVVGAKRTSSGVSIKKEAAVAVSAADLAVLVAKREAIHNRLLEVTGIEAAAANASGILTMTSATIANREAATPSGLPKKDLHWDYVLKEMTWLADDFKKERLRHQQNAKKISKQVDSYFQNMDKRKAAKSRQEALTVRRLASKISRDVRKFWLKINKVVAFKQKSDFDEIRQKAMDKHLVFLVKQTERYTNQLAENLKSGGEVGHSIRPRAGGKGRVHFVSSSPNGSSGRAGSPLDVDGSMDVGSVDSSSRGRGGSRRASLSNESADEILTMDYASDLADDETTEGEDGEFFGDDEEDDETTLIEEEERGGGLAAEEEIELLMKEGEVPIEQLRAMYANMPAFSDEEDEGDEEDGGDDDMDEDDDGDEENQGRATKTVSFSTSSNAAAVASSSSSSSSSSSAAATAISSKDSPGSGGGEAADEDDEFVGDDEEDDETTLIEEEERGGGLAAEEEIELLKKEGEVPIEQLRAMYANMPAFSDEEDEGDDDEDDDDDDEDDGAMDQDQDQGEDRGDEENKEDAAQKIVPAQPQPKNDAPSSSLAAAAAATAAAAAAAAATAISSKDSPGTGGGEAADEDDEFVGDDEEDDETTLIEEEERGGGLTVDEEIEMLKKEGEVPIEQLRAMYANMPAFSDEEDDDMDDDDDDDDDDDMDEDDEGKDDDMSVASAVSADSKNSAGAGKDKGKGKGGVDDALRRLEVADQAARSVRVERPDLLSKKLSLREYQHVGLNWLVSLHERRLNGILADEMGLGKTVQTISLLAYLAWYRGLWGPHLVVVPTSCIVNWESEFKKFCPGLKVLTYYGSAKHRKALRQGWSKLNTFHVCITSYQLVVQDSNTFRRKRWYYMILDEAHNIKNFKSQRWQTLLNFNTQRRLLLTGTPLQNNLMELWSLMHFLMPHIFRSRKEFSYWFNNPLTGMVEGNRGVNNDLITRLHSIMRPFLLRRLKKDVEKQLPGKYEHIVMCRLSKRQLFLYEEFMSRSSTRSSLKGGNFMGMMNILMQLRKVCNHPDLFESRPIESPFMTQSISYEPGLFATRALERNPLNFLSNDMMVFWRFDEDKISSERTSELRVSRDAFFTVEDVSVTSPRNATPSEVLSRYSVFVNAYRSTLQLNRQANREFSFSLSDLRCSQPRIGQDWRSVKAVTIDTIQTTGPLSIAARENRRLSRKITPAWYGLVKTIDERAEDMLDVIERFVFVLPKAKANGPQLITRSPDRKAVYMREKACRELQPVWEKSTRPLYPSAIRQSIFFPDRKLVQFDSGKLQTLCELLHKLKRGGHKVLIFTQMSKMLDILEVFLNLHAHSYVRLDGSTGVEKRQKLMDRFNSDPKLFVFILSTRSGGLGINLTGADTVIFYDSDWNPAMDAQAQDRAHRIGQTRDVHIYRLVCSSTVEENILKKARQKRRIDFLVMTEGNFTEETLFSSQGLRDIFGGAADDASQQWDDASLTRSQFGAAMVGGASAGAAGGGGGGGGSATSSPRDREPSQRDMEAAMAAAEDEEDVSALRVAKAEAVQEEAEFDENAVVVREEDDDDDDDESRKNKADAERAAAEKAAKVDAEKEEKDMEAEFASWQAKLGPDFRALESALKPVERFALNFRSDPLLDPYYSLHFVTEQDRLMAMSDAPDHDAEAWDVDEIEREKEEEEYRALSEGELLATNLTRREITRFKSWYHQERSKRSRARRKRILTGESWDFTRDKRTDQWFWFNIDTGEKRFTKPKILTDMDVLQTALCRGYNAVPSRIILHILSFLCPLPDRMRASEVCRCWRDAARDPSFFKRVLSIETGARDAPATASGSASSTSPSRSSETPTVKKQPQLAWNTYASVTAAVAAALPGDTIQLTAGHHWEASLEVRVPLRMVGEVSDPARVVLELTGRLAIERSAGRVDISGITIRRPRKLPQATASLQISGAKLSMLACVINNSGASGSAVFATNRSELQLYNCTIRGGLRSGLTLVGSKLLAEHLSISDNTGTGLSMLDGTAYLENSSLMRNGSLAASALGASTLVMRNCELSDNSNSAVVQSDPECGSGGVSFKRCRGDANAESMLARYRLNQGQSHAEAMSPV